MNQDASTLSQELTLNPLDEQHTKAFANVSAFVIAKNGKRVATIAFKFPRDGAGRLYAYVHWLGCPMVRGHAGGYGYSKTDAAVSVAAKKLSAVMPPDIADLQGCTTFQAVLMPDNGYSWEHHLWNAGFDVWQAV